MLKRFEGCWTALITPFKVGEVDWEKLKRIVQFQLKEGVTGLVPTGTTGESPTLSWEEHDTVIDTVIRTANKKVFVMAGTGSNSTEEALRGTRHAAEAGVDAVLLVDCYYNGPSSLELRKEYYEVIARAFPNLFIVPYVIPGRSGTELSAEDLAILASEFKNIAAVKEATGNVERMKIERDLCGENFAILSGDDDVTFKIMSDPMIRASGVVSVASNIAPAAIEQMCRYILKGDMKKSEKLASKLDPLFKIVTVKTEEEIVLNKESLKIKYKFRNPLPIKTAMVGLGMISELCRQPLGKMTIKGVEIVRDALKTVWKNSPEILEPIQKFYGVDIEKRLTDDSIWKNLAYR